MKKIKIKPKFIFKLVYLVIIIANIYIVYYLYNFLNENVYETFALNENFLSAQVKNNSEGINKDGFEIVNNNLNNKLNKKFSNKILEPELSEDESENNEDILYPGLE